MSEITTIKLVKGSEVVIVNTDDVEKWKAEGWKIEGEAPAATTKKTRKETE